MKPLTLIVAMTPSGVIAKDGKIPWHIPEDMKRFKQLTTGHAIIMGRRTYDSIGRPLPNRTNIVLTHESANVPVVPGDSALSNVVIVSSPQDALGIAYEHDVSPYVIGGGEIYNLFMPLATCLEITYVSGSPAKSLINLASISGKLTLFANPSLWDWRCVAIEQAETPDVEFMTFERRVQP